MERFYKSTIFRFIIVGIINTVFGTSIMFVFYNLLGLSYWISSASNYFFGSILSFFLNKHFTFKNKDRSPYVILRFILNISVCYFLAYGLAKPLVNTLFRSLERNLRENMAMAIGSVIFVVLNYLGQRFFAFRDRD